MTVTVIVPWRPGCPYRERAWAWVRARYARDHPDWRVVEAHAGDGDWCKATAVNPAVDAAPDGIVLVADADVWCDELDIAIAAVTDGAGWAVPHYLVCRLTEDATTDLFDGAQPAGPASCERVHQGVRGGGIVIARRDTLREVPLDERFVGWGQEDMSWALALASLGGRSWRGTAPLLHLWHPPQQRLSRRVGSMSSYQLHRRYRAARRDPALMRNLLTEARR